MKNLLILGLLVAAVGASPVAKKHEDFKIQILEKGTEFEQEVYLDEDEHIVTVHVPAHNDVDETYFITDTRKHMTVKVAPQHKMCFLTKNDPEELPPADVWRKTKEFTQNKLVEDTQSHIKRRSYQVSGSVSAEERQDLPTGMQKMCDGLPTVWTEVMNTPEDTKAIPKMKTYINYTRMEEWETTRFKRQLPFIDRCSKDDTAQKCVVYENSCYRVLNCSTKLDVVGRDGANCNELDHIYEDVRCCKPCCLKDVPADNPSQPCSREVTKEELCPGVEFI